MNLNELEKLKGKLLAFLYKAKLTLGIAKEPKGKRVKILFPTYKEEFVHYQDILYVSKNIQIGEKFPKQISLINELQENIEKIKEFFNLKELWEVLVEEVEEISIEEAVELVLNKKPSDVECIALIKKILEERNFFKITKPNFLQILSKEEVEQIITQKNKELERLRLISEGENIISSLLEGKTDIDEEKKSYWLNLFKEYFLWEDKSPFYKITKEVLSKKGLTEPVKLFNFLVKTNVFSEDENIDLLKLKFPTKFSEKVIKETHSILHLEDTSLKREDLTNLYTFTIDAEETQDFDDALSFIDKGDLKLLYVHITDVASFIKPGMELWKSALERAITLYMPDEIIPMFPFELSHKKFSLVKGEIKPALSFKFVFNKEDILDFEIIPSIIKVDERFSYSEIDQKLQKNEDFWKNLYNLLLIHKKIREKNGAFAIFLPEIQVKILENNELTIQKIEMTPARELVAEAMILANAFTAKFLYENNIPSIYRSQAPPFEIIENPEDKLYLKIIQLKYFAKSELSTKPSFHSGLGLSFYTTLTSPIRRFLDLLNQYQLISFLKKEEMLSEDALLKILAELSENLTRALTIQSKRQKYFLLKYLQKCCKDQLLDGIVIEVFNKKAKVYLPDFNLTGEISYINERLSPGQEIKISIEKINPRWDILKFRLAKIA